MIERYFLAHPRTVDEGYVAHMGHSLFFARHLLTAGCAALVHAFVPALFERTGSTRIVMLHDRMVTNRRRIAAKEAPAGLTWVI